MNPTINQTLYKPLSILQDFSLTHMVTVHYFEYPKDFYFPGESHNFWEFLYVDKGQVFVSADGNRQLLKQGDMIFHGPNEFHTVECDGKVAPNLIVVSFVAQGEILQYLQKQTVKIDSTIKQHLSYIVQEANLAYDSDLSDPYLDGLTRHISPTPGAEQLIKCHLSAMLIHIIRRLIPDPTIPNQDGAQEPLHSVTAGTLDMHLSLIETYINNHMDRRITLKELSHSTLLSPATMARAIKKRHHVSVMTFIEIQKIAVAKGRIREGQLSFSQIAQSLGYLTANHFSRVFKKHMHMTPSEYAKRIKV